MTKFAIITPAVGVLLFASVATAQVYYPPTTYQNTYPTYNSSAYTPAPLSISTFPTIGNCVILTRDLSFGSRGQEVRQLQRFLVSLGFPGSGNWMITGYYGKATTAAVRNFQQQSGLPMTGYVDAATRNAVQSRSCGFGYPGFPTTPTYPTYPTYPTTPTYPTYPYNTISITSLSMTSGAVGTMVTIYGNGFDTYSNTVRFGQTSVNASSNNSTSIVFYVPSVSTGLYQIYVTNSRGTSNTVSFTVTSSSTGCYSSGYNYGSNCNNCNYNYGYLPTGQAGNYGYNYGNQCGQISLNSITPSSGLAGTSATLYGSGFSTNGNTIYFGQGVISNVYSYDGTTLAFTIPTQIGSQYVAGGTYPVYVRNASGQTSNTINFTVTGGGSGSAPVITSVNGPTSLNVGVQGTWTLNLNAPYGSYVTTSVQWGDENYYGYTSAAPQSTYISGSQMLTFTHTYQQSGTYTVRFTVSGTGGTNTSTQTVTVGGSGQTGQLYLSALEPNFGRVGNAIILRGTGFPSTGNDVHFGVGGVKNLVSTNNGTIITLIIPSWVSPCDLIQSGYYCGAPTTQVTPGMYPIYVTSSMGATNVLNFTVQP